MRLLLASAFMALCLLLTPLYSAEVQVYFSPHGGCLDAITREIGQAKKSVLVQAYSFTSGPLASALVAARARGVDVQVIICSSRKLEFRSKAEEVHRAGVPVYWDNAHYLAHNKVIVVDKATVITGSYNFSNSAESYNAENLLVIKDQDVAKKYVLNWELHKSHSK